jgi:hypothetical protein
VTRPLDTFQLGEAATDEPLRDIDVAVRIGGQAVGAVEPTRFEELVAEDVAVGVLAVGPAVGRAHLGVLAQGAHDLVRGVAHGEAGVQLGDHQVVAEGGERARAVQEPRADRPSMVAVEAVHLHLGVAAVGDVQLRFGAAAVDEEGVGAVEAPVQADVLDIPEAAATSIGQLPAAGAFTYCQTGTHTVAGQAQDVPATVQRTVSNVRPGDEDSFSYNVTVVQRGITTVTSYNVVRSGAPNLDGIYLTQVVTTGPGGATEVFAPSGAGLRLFVDPAASRRSFQSVAVDAVHETAMTLEGVVVGRERVDVCGTLVEGWAVTVKIGISRLGPPDDSASLNVDTTFVVVPQLGGLIVSEQVGITGTDDGAAVVQQTEAIVNDLTPSAAGS